MMSILIIICAGLINLLIIIIAGAPETKLRARLRKLEPMDQIQEISLVFEIWKIPNAIYKATDTPEITKIKKDLLYHRKKSRSLFIKVIIPISVISFILAVVVRAASH